jgi:hypothetical protein
VSSSKVRKEVFVEEQGISEDIELDNPHKVKGR